jgi:ketosteroid isomerase-like protein
MQHDISDSDVPGAAAALVENFYALLASGDAAAVATFVSNNFAADAQLIRPESLPGGGVRSGVERIGRFMSAAVVGGSGLELRSVHVAPGVGSVAVFAELGLTVGELSTTALEWWTYTDGRFTSLTAYYWDTAALLAPTEPG